MKNLLFITAIIALVSCSDNKDWQAKILEDDEFEMFINLDNEVLQIFKDKSFYFEKIKQPDYLDCYAKVFESIDCDSQKEESCNFIDNEDIFLDIIEAKCQRNQQLIKLKKSYPQMDGEALHGLVQAYYKLNNLNPHLEIMKYKLNEKD